MLVRDFYRDIYLPRCKERLRKITQSSYRTAWRKYIEPYMGDMELNDITPRFLDNWIKEAGVHAGVWRQTKAMIRVAYKYELIDRDPCDRVLNPPPRGKPNPPTLSKYEMERLMDGFKGHILYPNVCCSCLLGLRREESFGLEWEDFHWDENRVYIQRGLQYVDGESITVEPKTVLSRRKLPIPSELKSRIHALRGTGRLMGTGLNAMTAANRYRYHCIESKLKWVPMSNLRTSWATYMVNNGYPITLISRWMGHADVETTVRWYTKPSEDDLVQIVDAWQDAENMPEPIVDKPKPKPSVPKEKPKPTASKPKVKVRVSKRRGIFR